MAKFLGIDTGGTFTDFILLDDEARSIRIHKVLSTPQAPEQAIMQGIAEMAISPGKLSVIHGSTVATNAVLEGKGARTVYITNRGLADVLTIGRQAREELYNLTPVKKPPLIDPGLCIEVNSRIGAHGEQLQLLSGQELSSMTARLRELAPDAVAINLLFSFYDETEEIKIERAIAEQTDLRHLFISRSSDVLPEYKEFERGMTTALNARVGPLMQGYLQHLEDYLAGIEGQQCTLCIMQSSGGITSAGQAGRYPVNLLLSGPAGGLKGAQTVAAASGEERLLSFDMGGTSTDVSIIDKEIGFTSGAKIAGYPVAVPMVDMHTIGAGGGSIARLDAGGMLLVGPSSAGASPGPASYGMGGTLPTVTDANVVLGRLQPGYFLGGKMQLDKNAAIAAVNTIAKPLGISVEATAAGIIDVVNDHMVRALRVMSVERGEDPQDFSLVSFGGAGGLHVCALAEELEMKRALIPVNAGVLSALGMLAAEASRERSRTVNRRLQQCDVCAIEQAFEQLLRHAISELVPQRATGNGMQPKISTKLSVDVRYHGQSHTLNLPWKGLDKIEAAFHRQHESNYGHALDMEVELVNLRVRVMEQRRSFALPAWQAVESMQQRLITLPDSDKPVKVYNRAGLDVGQVIEGPALITETCATTWLADHWTAQVDHVGNIRLSVNKK